MEKQAKLKEHIVIDCKDDDEKIRIGTRIHERLRGNPDYIENRVILNIDEPKAVHMYVYEDATIDYKSIIHSVM